MARPLIDKKACLSAALFGVLHLIVDAASVSAVWRTSGVFAIILGYDLLAFSTQFPFGVFLDRWGVARPALFAGLILPALALLLVPISPVATMVAAGVGNALFHLGAGSMVLRRSGDAYAGPAGIFVAPGTLGLALGMWMGKTGVGPAWPWIAALLLGLVLADRLSGERTAEAPRYALVRPPAGILLPLILLLVSVLVRSFVGFGGTAGMEKSLLSLLGLPLAVFLGKTTGGVLSDRYGWLTTSVFALLLSAPLIAFGHGRLAMLLPGMLLFQMTMPATLCAAFRLMPDRPATAFGLPCLALILGALPTFFPWGQRLYGPSLFMALIIGSAACLFFAFRRPTLGLGGRLARSVS